MFKANNDRIAMLLCPSWALVPPVALAYIKGAVKNRRVDCFDLNLEFERDLTASGEKFTGFEPFMTINPDFVRFERSCGAVSSKYSTIISNYIDKLKGYGTIGFSVYQENIVFSTVLSRKLRELGVVTIAGGPSMNMDKHVFTDYLIKGGSFDIAVLGIAEDVIEGLLDKVSAGEPVSDIPGLVLRDTDGKAVYTTAKENRLDVFSPPDYGDFDFGDYPPPRNGWIQIYTVTGCKGKCEFCTIHEFYPKFRMKPVENIKKEILLLKEKHNLDSFFFSDGMFLGSKQPAMEIFDFAIENNIKLGIQIRMLPYWEDEELVEKASKCVFYFQIGFETASPNVRKAMGKMVSQERTTSIFKLFYRYKLTTYTNIITGYPNETEEDFKLTYDFLDEYFKVGKGIGHNNFFLPNSFPLKKYNIIIDKNGFWKSDTVNIYDRFSRVARLRALEDRHGRQHDRGFGGDGLEGIPLGAYSAGGEALKEIKVEKFVDEHKAEVGVVDKLSDDEDYICASGWAVPPDGKKPAGEIIFTDEKKNIIAWAPVTLNRGDVAAKFNNPELRTSGWVAVFNKVPPSNIRIYLYMREEKKAYLLGNSFFVKQPGKLLKKINRIRKAFFNTLFVR